ncbi:MAG: FlgO family outer membrane protein [Bacteroidota bacterium]|nr:FlgO family outer membrane protein [Bacteroidota bacterium]MDP4235811.1 FlgO family outer membrane protein [Bacteroidota bacterium]
MSDIFISYSRHDSEQAKVLAGRLRAAGANVWMDSTTLTAAETWSAEIVGAINRCDVFLLLLSPTAVVSHNVNKEVSLASEKRKMIVPIMLERCELSEAMEYALAGLQHVKIWDEEGLERAFAKIGITGSGFSQNVPETKPREPVRAKKTRLLLRALTAVGVLAIAFAVYTLFFSKLRQSSASEIRAVVVLPFENLSTDKENEYFADGMTSTLIDMLVPVTDLRVVDRSTSMEFKSSKQDIKHIASLLDCRYVVNGTIQRQADRVMINAQMTDVRTGSVLFSKSFFGTTRDLMQLQQQIAQNIVVELQLAFGVDTSYVPLGGKPASPEAWDLCMQADYQEMHRKLDSSIALYILAARLSPDYAYPYLEVAREYGNKYMLDTNGVRNLALADSFFAIGKRLDTAQQYSHYIASWIASVHHNYDQAIAEASTYLKKQPTRPGGYYLLGLAYELTDQHGMAADNLIEDLKRDPTAIDDRILLLRCLWNARDTMRLRQQSSEALPIFDAWLKRHPDDKDVRNNSIPLALVWSGRGDEACKRMEDLLRTPNVDSQYVLNTAAINALSGKLDRAMEIMRKKISTSGVQSVDFERTFFDNLRSFPEFQAWVKQKKALTKKNV